MRLRPITTMPAFAALGLLLFSLTAWAKEPSQLTILRNNLDTKRLLALQPLLTSYRRQLDELEKTLQHANDADGAKMVQQEREALDRELVELSKAVEVQPVVAIPPPPPPMRHEPRTLINSVQGLAGATSFSENNIYTFSLPEVGNTSSLTFYATGRRSPDSYGNVWLVTPEGKKEKVTKWKSSNFTTPATEVKSYQKLKPIISDISDHIKLPGKYQVEFEWTDGVDPLVIYRVELTS
ncbi:MAG: hypothetical protein HGA96_09390 [Desulfobulbaceae bacterium]|nr:hypothetical protein [Desulfobulbaceae bacterium]